MDATVRHNSDKRVIRTKKAIRNALFRLMEQKGIEDIGVSELTSAANVNRRTFYTHYRNMTDILDELEAELVSALAELLSTIDYSDYKTSVARQFVCFNDLIVTEYLDYFNLMKIDTRGILVTRLRNAIRVYAENIFRTLPAHSPMTNLFAASFVAGGFLAFFSEWYYAKDKMPINEAAEMVGAMAESCFRTFEK